MVFRTVTVILDVAFLGAEPEVGCGLLSACRRIHALLNRTAATVRKHTSFYKIATVRSIAHGGGRRVVVAAALFMQPAAEYQC